LNKKTIIVAIIIIAIIAVFGAYFYMNSQDDGTVNIGYLPSDHNAALFVADAQDKYQAEGIKTNLVQFNNGGDLMTAMASGEVDVGYVGITSVLSSIQKGVPVKIVSAVQTEGSGLVVSSNSSITSIKDLKGKTVGTPGEASIQNMLLKYALQKNGMNESDVKISAMKVPSMNDAIKTGKIDAMMTYEPYVTMATSQGYGKEIADSSNILPNHPCCVVTASDDFINNHPDELKKIVEIHANETNYINSNVDKSAELLPSDIVANSTVEKQSLNKLHFISGLSSDYKDSVRSFMDIEVQMGLLKQKLTDNQIFYDINGTNSTK